MLTITSHYEFSFLIKFNHTKITLYISGKKMKNLDFRKLDAFAQKNSSGNPAGVIFLKSSKEINEEEMLKTAWEMRSFVSEVAFLHEIGKNFFGLKFYSAKREVDFCGHATIAAMYELFSTRDDLEYQNKVKIRINSGVLEVENRIKTEDAVFIKAPQCFVKKAPDLKKISTAMNIHEKIIDKNLPVKIFNAGLSTLLIPITGLEEIIKISPDLKTLNDFCMDNGIDIVEVFTDKTKDKNNHFRVRVFAPTFGYLEDPATGSGNSALGYYLIDNGLWKNKALIIEQNSSLENFNIIKLKNYSNGKNHGVIFGGGAVKRISGEYHVH